MATGTVLWFNPTKGYGFIAQDASGLPDVFVHVRDLPGYGVGRGKRGSFVAGRPDPVLEKGQRVEFEINETARGLHASNVRVLPVPSADTEGERGSPIVELNFDLGIK